MLQSNLIRTDTVTYIAIPYRSYKSVYIGIPYRHQYQPVEIGLIKVLVEEPEIKQVNTYGYLYNWFAVGSEQPDNANPVTDIEKSLTMDGWRITTKEDFEGLVNYLTSEYGHIDSGNIGKVLKDRRTVITPLGGEWETYTHPRWGAPEDGIYGTDEFNLAFLGGMERSSRGTYAVSDLNLGDLHSGWTSTILEGWFGGLEWPFCYDFSAYKDGYTVSDAYPFGMGFAVRVMRDATQEELELEDGELCEDYIGTTGIKYQTIKVGPFVITRENLRDSKFSDGTSIPRYQGEEDWADAGDSWGDPHPAWCTWEELISINILEDTMSAGETVEINGLTYGVVKSNTGRLWLDRNLGASRVATSPTDSQAYGDLYQWGRLTDGHEKRSSGLTDVQSNSDVPGHSDFIVDPVEDYDDYLPYKDWRDPHNDNLWQGYNGINNPVPKGWRVPTREELNEEYKSWDTWDASGAFSSPLKLPLAGERLGIYAGGEYYAGDIISGRWTGNDGFYWSTETEGYFGSLDDSARVLRFGENVETGTAASHYRSHGLSVRPIRPHSNTAEIIVDTPYVDDLEYQLEETDGTIVIPFQKSNIINPLKPSTVYRIRIKDTGNNGIWDGDEDSRRFWSRYLVE